MTLVILAAGLGSRFKGGLKQLAAVGPNGETIMELSIKDAKEVGFDKVVFIIRPELEKDFEETIIPNIDINYEYAYQKLDDIPLEISVNREKPWGTGHALLALRNIVKDNFVIINADDYYGKESMKKMIDFFNENDKDYAMVGFKMKNTIFKDNGANRGVCNIENDKLISIEENYKIKKTDNKFINDEKEFNPDTYVSMNMWGFRPSIFKLFEREFIKFLEESDDLEKKEFLIPTVISNMIKNNEIDMKILFSDSICTGITYNEDIEFVRTLL